MTQTTEQQTNEIHIALNEQKSARWEKGKEMVRLLWKFHMYINLWRTMCGDPKWSAES